MTNKQIAKSFSLLADLMELHQENPFKIKSYQSAYITLRKLDTPLSEMTAAEIDQIKGVGKAIGEKIQELLHAGSMNTLEQYKAKTPEGVVEMMQLPGFGPKKVYQIWQDLEITSIGELWYACNENRLIELKGFGLKTQEELKKKIEYFQKSRNKKLYADVAQTANKVLQALQQLYSTQTVAFTGAFRRQNPIIEKVEFLIATDDNLSKAIDSQLFVLESQQQQCYWFHTVEDELPIAIYTCSAEEFGSKQFLYTASKGFLNHFIAQHQGIDFKNLSDEKDVFTKANMPYINAALREDIYTDFSKLSNIKLIENQDIKGVLHTHTTYSDGLNSIAEMAAYAQKKGYQYIGITDHSQAAFYANGLKPERVLQQMAEIDSLNQKLQYFKIYKGIESDILYDGSLDYQEEILQQFDFVIASVHSQLKMTEEKATARLIKAIENPYTTILGHPTGRLLLSREGYPIDFKKVIAACAANNVAIELNANPWRLDLDWTWIAYAIDHGVKIAINPDAHACEGIDDIQYGVLAAQKGCLTASACLNYLDANEFEQYCKSRKS